MSVSVLLGAVAAALAATGACLLYTSTPRSQAGIGTGERRAPRRRHQGHALHVWLQQAGLGEVGAGEFAAAVAVVFVVGATGGFVLFGGLLPALMVGCFAAGVPVSSYRRRRGRGCWRNCVC
jgi:hypothetical protein